MVRCLGIDQKECWVPKEKFKNRVATYLVVLDETGSKILLAKLASGHYAFPGGEKEPVESLEEAGVREVREETGIEVQIRECLGWHRSLFYYEPDDEAMDNVGHFFSAEVVGDKMEPYFDSKAFDDPIDEVMWVQIEDLKPDMLVMPEVFWMIAKARERKKR